MFCIFYGFKSIFIKKTKIAEKFNIYTFYTNLSETEILFFDVLCINLFERAFGIGQKSKNAAGIISGCCKIILICLMIFILLRRHQEQPPFQPYLYQTYTCLLYHCPIKPIYLNWSLPNFLPQFVH